MQFVSQFNQYNSDILDHCKEHFSDVFRFLDGLILCVYIRNLGYPFNQFVDILSESFLAFNILSVGLDAFVTHMTNKMKGQLPGDSYKLWVDIATLFYDRIYRVEPMGIEAYDAQGRRIAAFEKKLLLLAFGISGRRTYGAGIPILPDDRNVCGVEEMPLLKKLKLKKLFTSGQHADRSEAHMLSAAKVLIRYSEPILAQMDGEPVLLDREDFPITLSLTEPRIPTLRLV